MLAYDPSLRLSAEDCLTRRDVFPREEATLPDNNLEEKVTMSTIAGRNPTPEQPKETAFLGEKGYVPKRVAEIEQQEAYFSKVGERGKSLAAGNNADSGGDSGDKTRRETNTARKSDDAVGNTLESSTTKPEVPDDGVVEDSFSGGPKSEELHKGEGNQAQDPSAAPDTAGNVSSVVPATEEVELAAADAKHEGRGENGLDFAIEAVEECEPKVAEAFRELLATGEGAAEFQKALKVLLRPRPQGELVGE